MKDPTDTTPRTPLPGGLERIGRYQLVRHLGRGGMADVYRARDVEAGRDVALKVLLPVAAGEADAIAMLLDEARIVGAITHPNVVALLDAGRADDEHYLAMELVDGEDLRHILGRAPTGLPLPIALHVVGEVAAALDAVHRAVDGGGAPREIVHRDISPGNVLVGKDGAVKLSDFGIARARERLTRTRTGIVKGKSRYLAPELLDGRPADQRCDLYSLGVVGFDTVFGRTGMESVRTTPYGPMFTWPPRTPHPLPKAVEAFLRKLTALEPADRYQSAAEVLEALAPIRSEWAGELADADVAQAIQHLDRRVARLPSRRRRRRTDDPSEQVEVEVTSPFTRTPTGPAPRRTPSTRMLVVVIGAAFLAGAAIAGLIAYRGEPAPAPETNVGAPNAIPPQVTPLPTAPAKRPTTRRLSRARER
jgi:eukaryotic-like serine/threonine-protein kinase